MKYMVIKGFMDVDGFKKEGSIIEVDDHRAAKLRRYGLIAGSAKESAAISQVETAAEPRVQIKTNDVVEVEGDMKKDTDIRSDTETDLEHIGGGFYLLPNGLKVKGKTNALIRLNELKDNENAISRLNELKGGDDE